MVPASYRLLSISLMLAWVAAASPYDRQRPPLSCEDPVVLRMVGAGLHFQGSVPEGYQPTERGLRDPETGEELRIRVEQPADREAVLHVGGTRVEMSRIRQTSETDEERRCSADFIVQRGDRTTRGEADYFVGLSGLEFRVGGTFSVEGVEIQF